MKRKKGSYARGHEVAAQRKLITAAEMNDRNREFWEIRALQERVASATGLTPEQRETILLHGPQMIRRRIAEDRQADEDREIGEKQRQHGKELGDAARRSTDERARAFAQAVSVLRQKKSKLSKTGAVQQVADSRGIPISTAWDYMKRAQKPLQTG